MSERGTKAKPRKRRSRARKLDAVTAALREQVRADARNRPGVYRMIGPGERVLYVGKSVRVRSRLLSWFREPRGAKGNELLRLTERIEWEYVSSEFGALLLEMKSIKRWRPPYNVVHKRDRAFAFVKLTREPAPRLQAVSRVTPDGSRYFGPFSGPDRIRIAVREISDVLGLRDCARSTPVRFADQLDFFTDVEHTPLCLRGDLGRCLAPCAARCTRSAYHERAGIALRFLRGEADAPLRVLRERMAHAASSLNFEYAALLRDRIERLETLREELIAAREEIEALTFLYPVSSGFGDDRVYIVRRGMVLAEMPYPRTPAERAALNRRAAQLFEASARGLTAVGAAEATEILMVARWFRRHPAELERVWRPDDPELDAEIAV